MAAHHDHQHHHDHYFAAHHDHHAIDFYTRAKGNYTRAIDFDTCADTCPDTCAHILGLLQ